MPSSRSARARIRTPVGSGGEGGDAARQPACDLIERAVDEDLDLPAVGRLREGGGEVGDRVEAVGGGERRVAGRDGGDPVDAEGAQAVTEVVVADDVPAPGMEDHAVRVEVAFASVPGARTGSAGRRCGGSGRPGPRPAGRRFRGPARSRLLAVNDRVSRMAASGSRRACGSTRSILARAPAPAGALLLMPSRSPASRPRTTARASSLVSTRGGIR